MAWVFITSACFGCGRMFAYHPNKVPSIRIRGKREPLCLACVIRVNPLREKNGLEPIKPLPGAYDPVEESQLNWQDHD